MRWGVGKGKFRNVTSILLCLLLGATFYFVWTFFQIIKPLTIDTSPQALTATIGDRLLNIESRNTDTLSDTQLLLLCMIADTANKILIYEVKRETEQLEKKSLDETTIEHRIIPSFLANTQEELRKHIGIILNETFTPISEFQLIERRVLSTYPSYFDKLYNASLTSSILNDSLTALERTFLNKVLRHPIVDSAEKQYSILLDSINVHTKDRNHINEYRTRLANNLVALRLAMCDDAVSYIELNSWYKKRNDSLAKHKESVK
jgi:hypothetical protein